MSNGATRYDAATIEQAVLTLLVEMRALIKVFERKGLLRPGEVSCEILTMKNLAAATMRHRQRREGNGPEGARPSAHPVSSGNDRGAHERARSQTDNRPNTETHPWAPSPEQRSL